MLATALAWKPCMAQCEKEFILTASMVEYLDSTNKVVRTQDDNSNIRISRQSVTITPQYDPPLSGKVNHFACNWDKPWQDGKTEIKAHFTDRGTEFPITMILQAQKGHLSLLILFDDNPNRKIRIWPSVKEI